MKSLICRLMVSLKKEMFVGGAAAPYMLPGLAHLSFTLAMGPRVYPYVGVSSVDVMPTLTPHHGLIIINV